MVLYVDIETYSSVDLKTAGVYRYTESPDFEIIMVQWAYDDDPVKVASTPEQIDDVLFNLGMWSDHLRVAHNAQFERICFSAILLDCAQPFTYLPPDEWEDTAALAAEAGYPRSLDALAKALGVEEKDSAGTALINWFCKPDRNGKRRMPQDHPEKWEQFCAYGEQDVTTLRQVHKALPAWPDGEREIYLLDQRINDRGVKVDLDMCEAASTADNQARAAAGVLLQTLLSIDNAGSVQQITKALASRGLDLPDMRADTISTLLADPDLDPTHRRALELRQQISLVAAAKYTAALRMASPDERLRGQFRFFGAHTGRWSSRGAQLHNSPRVSFVTKDEEKNLPVKEQWALAHQRIETLILDLLMGVDPGPKVLKALIRSMFLGPFTVLDYSAIEARGLAWIAGEEWVLQAFRDKRDIYVETAKRMGGLTRQQGKVAVLALGYQGGVNSLRSMGAEGDDGELQSLVYKYRDANPRIRRIWQTMERAFVDGGSVGRLQVERANKGKDRKLILPSGRPLTYHNVRVAGEGRDRRITFDDPQGYRTDTYGGRLIENATQGTTRDLLADAMLRLDEAGFQVVMHVHDEVVIEGDCEVEDVAAVMQQAPAWADGLPVDVEGFRCQRYRK